MKNNQTFNPSDDFASFVIPGSEERRLIALEETYIKDALAKMTATASLNTLEIGVDE